jgi:hypothetical protein
MADVIFVSLICYKYCCECLEFNLVLFFQDKKKGTGAGVYCHGTRRKLSYSRGQYTTVFQAEVYAIKACAV